jgi:hypothetical protein
MEKEQAECSEIMAFKLQTPVNHPEETIQHLEHGENFKLRNLDISFSFLLLTMVSQLHVFLALQCSLLPIII